MQDPTLALLESQQVPLHPTLQFVQVLLNGITAFWCVSHSSQLLTSLSCEITSVVFIVGHKGSSLQVRCVYFEAYLPV